MGQKGFGRCFQRDEGGRSVEVAHISQRIKGTERKFEGHEEKHHGPESPQIGRASCRERVYACVKVWQTELETSLE